MINLLPPAIKTQIAFSKRNAQVLKLMSTLGVSAVILGGLFFTGQSYLNGRNSTASQELHDTLNAPSTEVEKTVQSVNQRLATIKSLGRTKHNYSRLLRELAGAIPRGAFLREIVLTGDDKPVRLNIIANSYSAAVSVRDSLASLDSRISAVDIESISSDSGNFLVTVNVAFKKGQAR